MGLKVTIPYDEDWKALTWAKKHCPSYITNNGERLSSDRNSELIIVIHYYFGNPWDATMFALKWL